jgi:DMSO/TMAO reductase YedYZ molybdopterin-dependent catalytic subunit
MAALPAIKISGEIDSPLNLTAADLDAFRPEEKIDDVSKLGSSRRGGGVYLQAILRRARPKAGVRYITFRSPSDDFSASVPIDRIAEMGLVIYTMDGKPMTREQGGPFRFIIPNPAACKTDEIDECTNVKFLEEISFTTERQLDTRPRDEDEHAKLHAH